MSDKQSDEKHANCLTGLKKKSDKAPKETSGGWQIRPEVGESMSTMTKLAGQKIERKKVGGEGERGRRRKKKEENKNSEPKSACGSRIIVLFESNRVLDSDSFFMNYRWNKHTQIQEKY